MTNDKCQRTNATNVAYGGLSPTRNPQPATRNPQPTTRNPHPVICVNPLLTQIREQLPNEAASFGLVVRGAVVEAQLPAFNRLAEATQADTRQETGNLYYRFFFNAQDPLEYVLLEVWANFPALAAHFESFRLPDRSDRPAQIGRRYSMPSGPQKEISLRH
jgi:quinol monooxygenase YgiN